MIIDIKTYKPVNTDIYLFDTNIWLYLFCPLGQYNQLIIRNYSQFFNNVLKTSATIYFTSLVASEFINRYLHLEFYFLQKKNPSKYKKFKDHFRGTQDYLNASKLIESTVKVKILKVSRKLDDNFSGIDLEKVLIEMSNSDFNDEYLK
jgi:predicted nucleic acid-binding protein